jgi:hypothetical protein
MGVSGHEDLFESVERWSRRLCCSHPGSERVRGRHFAEGVLLNDHHSADEVRLDARVLRER